MNFSTDDQHRATLDVLRETLAYLERLPPVPVTRDFCAKLRAHLAEPAQSLVAQGTRELHGTGPWMPIGLPLLEVSVVDEVLHLSLPQGLTEDNRKTVLDDISRRLAAGTLSVGLASRNHIRAAKPK